MRVVFRADASVQIGTGHVMRCLTLAEELSRQGHQCIFITRDHSGHLGELITSKGFDLHLLAASDGADPSATSDNSTPHAEWLGVPWQQDAEQTLEVLPPLAADWLVVDNYALDARWERQVATAVGRIMVIDDLADRRHHCDFILDQNLGRQSEAYDGLVPTACKRMVGSEFPLLRPEFKYNRKRSLQRRKAGKLGSILITMGGVDKADVTSAVLRVIKSADLPQGCQITVVMGKNAPWVNKVLSEVRDMQVPVRVLTGVSDMAEIMTDADLAIGAAGGTGWERCCLGVPTLLITMAANQVLGARALEEAGAAIWLGEPEEMEEQLLTALRSLSNPINLMKMSDAAVRICDGKGAERVAKLLLAGEL